VPVFNVHFSKFRVQSWLFALTTAAFVVGAESNAPVRALSNGQFVIGLVTLDITNRSVTFAGAVNLREETVEYALVHKTGKTHESIFRTDARPQDIHMAMLLLGAKPVMTNTFGADGKARPLGDKIWAEVSWTDKGAFVRCPIEETVLNKETGKPLPRGEWIYNGSNFSEGMFTAQRDGSIISIHIDPDALINNPRPGRENDDLYKPNTALLPPLGTRVDITLRLTQ
jgi:hypothetical protein